MVSVLLVFVNKHLHICHRFLIYLTNQYLFIQLMNKVTLQILHDENATTISSVNTNRFFKQCLLQALKSYHNKTVYYHFY